MGISLMYIYMYIIICLINILNVHMYIYMKTNAFTLTQGLIYIKPNV